MNQRDRLEQWFLHYSDDVYKFLVYYTRHWDVEDLVQEVFIKAMKNIDSFEGRAQPKTWLLSIARNTAIDFLRKQRLRRWLPDSMLDNLKTSERTPEEILQLNEQKSELLHAVHQLKQIPLSKVQLVLGKPKEVRTAYGQKIYVYNVNDKFQLKVIFPAPSKIEPDPTIDHISVFYPRGTVNLMLQ